MCVNRENNNHVELVSDIMAHYPDEWIFFQVVEDDEFGQPYKGRLIAHSPDRDEIHKTIIETDVYHTALLYTGRVVPEGSIVLL